MTRRRPAVFYFRVAMATFALLLPLLSLIVLGSVWLWQQGYVLTWALGACTVTLFVYALERWIFRGDLPETAKGAEPQAGEAADPAWSVREAAAWAAIIELSNQVRPSEITSRDEIFDLGVRSIETVARSMHPGEEHALWKFTLPEALSLIERVSSQLSTFVNESIPLGDRMTVGQLLRVYRWRSAVNVAEQAYDIWRIIRLINPAAAATQEIREQLTRRAYDWGREELAKRLAQAYVREAGRAAIDLYSGRMRLAMKSALSTTAAQGQADSAADDQEPVRILVAGLPGSGRSRLIDALLERPLAFSASMPDSKEYVAHVLPLNASNQALLIEGPDAPTTAGTAINRFYSAAGQSDVIIWVTSATSTAHAAERQILDEVRRQSASRIRRKPQPILGVLTNLDEAQSAHMPGSDISATASGLNVPLMDIVTASSGAGEALNVSAVRSRLLDLMPEANRVRLLRLNEQEHGSMKWSRVWSQVVNAGRAWKGNAN
ncbi:MAG: GTPase domain-containing protein [Hyphomicrobium sp.]